jgi:hypothetical protein
MSANEGHPATSLIKLGRPCKRMAAESSTRWTIGMNLDRIGAHRVRTRVVVEKRHVTADADVKFNG